MRVKNTLFFIGATAFKTHFSRVIFFVATVKKNGIVTAVVIETPNLISIFNVRRHLKCQQ